MTCRSTLVSGRATVAACPPDRSPTIGSSPAPVGDHRCHDGLLGWFDHGLRWRTHHLVCPVRASRCGSRCRRCRVLDLMTSDLDSVASDHNTLSLAFDSTTPGLVRITAVFRLMRGDSRLETPGLIVVRHNATSLSAYLRGLERASGRVPSRRSAVEWPAPRGTDRKSVV